jgi:predicted O-methyltransferase YrrM
LGTSYGYSTAWLAAAARDYGARLITLELSEKKVVYARDAIARAGLAAVVDFRVGNALDILPELPDSIGFVLIDLWKNLYVECLNAVYPKLASGAIIVADNMIQPESSRPEAAAYRKRVRELGLDSVLLPIGSGIEISTPRRSAA